MSKIRKDGTFEKGHIPWNKDLKGIHLSPTTEFKKGQKVGQDNNFWKGGIQINTNDVVYLHDGAGKRIRRPKKIYEDAGNVIPKNWVLYHIDKVMHNDELDNLIAIPRAILIKLNNGTINPNYQNIKEAIETYLETKKL
jgi:hypothetical protein